MKIAREDLVEYSILSAIGVAYLLFLALYWHLTGETAAVIAGIVVVFLWADALRIFAALACALIIGLNVHYFWTELMVNFSTDIMPQLVVTFIFMLAAFVRGVMTVK